MTAWLIGKQAKFIVKVLTLLALVAVLIDIGAGLFGGAHAAFWHIIPPGYVQIRPLSRYGGGTFYVKPWVAELHFWIRGVFFTCAALLVILGIAAKIAKSLPPKSDA